MLFGSDPLDLFLGRTAAFVFLSAFGNLLVDTLTVPILQKLSSVIVKIPSLV